MREVWRHRTTASEHVEETAPTRAGSLRPRESPLRHFANECHSAVVETAQGFEGDGAESVTWTIVVPEVLLQLVLVPAPGTGLLKGATHVASPKT
jgi:hypothetical protein